MAREGASRSCIHSDEGDAGHAAESPAPEVGIHRSVEGLGGLGSAVGFFLWARACFVALDGRFQ